jgi:hypothetical protein
MPQNAGGRGKDYRESDILEVFEQGPDWHSWSEVVDWLRSWGQKKAIPHSTDVRELLIRDFGRLQAENVPFTHDPGEAFKLARSHRPAKAGIERT